ncbi:MAG: aspartate/glutamate racemase family protein, partial [Vitreimonas sp.]
FQADIEAAISIPLLSMIDATADAAVAQGAERVGVLAADGCRRARLYHRAFAERDVEALFLPDEGQLDFMALLYRIKAGDVGDDVRRRMAAMALSLNARGAQAVVAACTEVPLVLSPDTLAAPVVSSTDALVARAVEFARGK